MSLRNILVYPDPLLNTKSKEVNYFGEETQQLIDDMFETMKDAEGIGLAAIQVGVAQRIAVLGVEEPLVIINPKIELLGDQKEAGEEGCLSLPGIRADISRSTKIRVKAQDRNGEHFSFTATGILAVCVQHEVDHMDGVLFINKLSPLARSKLESQIRNLIALFQENPA